MLQKLDEKNIELSLILFEMKQNLDIYKLISLNAQAINDKGTGKTFWGIVQKATLRLFIIDMCKIYEKEKRNKLNSIPELMDFIKSEIFKLQDFKPIEEFITKYSESIPEKDNYLEVLNEIIYGFIEHNADSLKGYKNLRNKKLVHAEDVEGLKFGELPNFDKMEELLEFGIDFYAMIHEAYVGGFPVQHKTDKRAFASLHSILRELEHEEIAVEFSE